MPDLKLGILGAANSGKSSLVHRFLTGTYIQEESPEGGRFKKEVIIDGQSYLLLIRDEGGPPEMQFTHWCDAVIFVFSLENEESLLTAHQYYLKMAHYRNMNDIPFILVGTQDYVNETNRPRCVDESRAHSLARELKNCPYYETSSIYGHQVERVFQEACQKVANLRSQMLLTMSNIVNANCPQNNRPTTPQSNLNIQPPNTTSSLRLLTGSHMSNGNVPPNVLSSISLTSLNTNNPVNTTGNMQTQLPQNGVSSAISNAVVSATLSINGNTSNSSSNNVLTSNNSNTSPQVSNSNSSSANNTPQSQMQQQQQQNIGSNQTTLAFYLANPHLLNSAALHSTSFPTSNNSNNSITSQNTPNIYNVRTFQIYRSFK